MFPIRSLLLELIQVMAIDDFLSECFFFNLKAFFKLSTILDFFQGNLNNSGVIFEIKVHIFVGNLKMLRRIKASA
jgi:hypothetical protein